MHLVVFIAYILTDCCIITCIHIFSSSAASVLNKFSVQGSSSSSSSSYSSSSSRIVAQQVKDRTQRR